MDNLGAILMFLLFIGISFKVGFKGLYYRLKGDKVDAIITNLVRRRRNSGGVDVYVQYMYNGQFYENIKLGFYQTGFYQGKYITLYLFPDKPTKPEHAGSIAFLLVGILLIAMFSFLCIKI